MPAGPSNLVPLVHSISRLRPNRKKTVVCGTQNCQSSLQWRDFFRGDARLIDEESRAAVLAPIEGSVGIDGREDEGVAGDVLREIRSQRKALIRQEQSAAMGGDDDGGDDSSGWAKLAADALDYLATHGKDLEPMAVIVEAEVRLDDAAGLAGAMTLLADLVETFWDQGLFPPEDDDGVEGRYQPISGLSGGSGDKDGALVSPIRRMTLAVSGGEALCHLDKVKADMAMAAAQTASSDGRAERIEEAEAIYRRIEQIVGRLSRATVKQAADDVGTALADWRRAIAHITERTKPRMPAASRVSEELQHIADWLQTLLSRFPDDAPAEVGADGDLTVSGEAAGAAPAGGFVAGKITRRDDALRAIGAAADYFSTYEPLSPIGTTLREVDRRARMSLHELLVELIPDESARESFYWRSGGQATAGARIADTDEDTGAPARLEGMTTRWHIRWQGDLRWQIRCMTS